MADRSRPSRSNGRGRRGVAVVCADHYEEVLPEVICLGAPIRRPDGAIRGAVDVTTPTEGGTPERLLPVVYAARDVGRELKGGGGG